MPASETKPLVEQIADTRAATRRVLEERVNSAIAAVDEVVARLHTDREATRRAIYGDEPAPNRASIRPQRTRSASTRKSTTNQRREKIIIEKVLPLNREGISYCRTIDLRQVETPREWQKMGCPPTYEEAYELPAWKKRIWDEKSRLTRKARMMPKGAKAS